MELRKLTVAAIALASAAPAAAQLQSERVERAQRVCVYQQVHRGTPNERRIGLGESCPPFYRSIASSLPAPPTARLESSEVRGGTRICNYSQLGKNWRFEISVAESCPISAGLVPRMP